MYLNVEMPESIDYEVIDNHTGTKLNLVQSADDKTGIIEMFLYDEDGLIRYDKKTDKRILFKFKPINGITLRKKEVK